MLYRINKNFGEADTIFKKLVEAQPEDIEVQMENIRFLRLALKVNHALNRKEAPEAEARHLIQLLRQKSDSVAGDLWAKSLTQCAKLIFETAKTPES